MTHEFQQKNIVAPYSRTTSLTGPGIQLNIVWKTKREYRQMRLRTGWEISHYDDANTLRFIKVLLWGIPVILLHISHTEQ